jgi:hypothetical protein
MDLFWDCNLQCPAIPVPVTAVSATAQVVGCCWDCDLGDCGFSFGNLLWEFVSGGS